MKTQRETYIQTLMANREVLEDYGRSIGLERGPRTSRDKYLMECFSRYLAEQVVAKEFPSIVKAVQEVFFNHWDVTLDYGDEYVGIESKFRLATSDNYPTDDISFKKGSWDDVQGKPILVVCTFTDGVVRAYDVNGRWNEGEWVHNETTGTEYGRENTKVSETKIIFSHEDCVFEIRIHVPPINGKKWTESEFSFKRGRT